jgi:hypothetical protein
MCHKFFKFYVVNHLEVISHLSIVLEIFLNSVQIS